MCVEVIIDQGRLQGSTSKDYKGNTIYQFQGIPYAKPPVGNLRFKPPQAPEPWEGVFDATKLGSACYSRKMMDLSIIIGSEDCLNLNIYTSTLHGLKPVMVWIHGGGFFSGSNATDLYGPDFLLTEDVVLVTINYRLGLLGFISFEDPALGVPGNAALKDMIMALNWVQNNIAYFGGDPGNVTIFGESAGGIAVHLLMLSPMGKGLFHKAIAQSGVGLIPSFRAPRGVGYLAGHLRLDTEQDVYEHLMKLSVEEVFQLQELFSTGGVSVNKRSRLGYVVEDGPEPFLAEDIPEVLYKGTFNQVPFMLGFMSNEGIVFEHFKPSSEPILKDKEDLISFTMGYEPGSPQSVNLAQKILDFYGTEGKFWAHSILSDCFFLFWIMVVVKAQVKKSQSATFLYKMTLETDLNFFKKNLNINAPGAYHCDDLGYLFKNEYVSAIEKNSREEVSMGKVLKLWTNFAKFGDPTPEIDSVVETKWQPVTIDHLNYLEIGEKLMLLDNPESERMRFWEEIFENAPVKEKMFL